MNRDSRDVFVVLCCLQKELYNFIWHMTRCIVLQINETVFQVMALNVVNLDEGIYVELAGVIEVTGGLGWSDARWQNLAVFRRGQKWP